MLENPSSYCFLISFFLLDFFLNGFSVLIIVELSSMAPAADHDDEIKEEKNPRPLDEDDIALLKTYVSVFKNPNLYLFKFLSLLRSVSFVLENTISVGIRSDSELFCSFVGHTLCP